MTTEKTILERLRIAASGMRIDFSARGLQREIQALREQLAREKDPEIRERLQGYLDAVIARVK